MLCLGFVKGGVRLFYIFGQFWDMLVHIPSLETVSNSSTTSWVISSPTIGTVRHGSVPIIDEKLLADMMAV